MRVARPMAPSLVRRLVLLAAAWSLVVLVVAGLSLSLFFNHTATTRFDDELGETVDGLLAGTSTEGGQVTPPAAVDPREQRAYSGEYWEIASPDGAGGLKALARSRSLWDRALAPPPQGVAALAKPEGQSFFYDAPGPLDQPLRVDALQARVEGYAQPVVFMAAEDRTPVNRDVRTFVTTIAVALGILGIGLILAVIIQVRVGLQPLFALRREVADVRTGKLERLEKTYPTELEPLAAELNALVAHNQQVVERQRTHVGNLAHALKTPLSVIMAEAGQTGGELAKVVARQAQIMSQQVDYQLRRARAAARTQGHGQRTEVGPVIDELARALERIFQNKIGEIRIACPDGLMFVGERQDLLEIAGNVMENACKWAQRRVRVTAAAKPEAPIFTLTVEDDGPGLAPELRETVLRRGERLDESAPGSGLGLSIVDELARAYDGSIELGDSRLGGLAVEIRLPRAVS
ncbi:MAG TPA: ATP-binding protein [Caulobacteraceae bacterium]|nr:ATP-binding protein [Caulobacteraceae bacterium]